MKIALHTLGCKLNFTESSAIGQTLIGAGFSIVPFKSQADVIIINTCTVTEAADKKCRNSIRKAIALSPDALIIVMGCYSQVSATEIAGIPGVSLVLGTGEKFDIVGYINNHSKKSEPEICNKENDKNTRFFPAWSTGDRTRAFLKIQDGCDYFCSYCTVPFARGRSRSQTIAETVKIVRQLAENGSKEIILTGVNIGDFGKPNGEKFSALLLALENIPGDFRIRISSLEPDLINRELIQIVAGSERFAHHFHIPLQSGCDRILGLMKRRYKKSLFEKEVEMIKNSIPDASIGADIIAGFPGETNEDYNETAAFLHRANLSYLHVFSYSDRALAASSQFPEKVASAEIAKRCKYLSELSEKKKRDFLINQVGKKAKVLFEKTNKQGKISGFTGNYIRVEVPWNKEYINKFVSLTLSDIEKNGNVTGIIDH